MIELKFTIDDAVLEEEKSWFPNYDAPSLGISFMMPVSFKVNGTEIFQFPDGSPVSIALLDVGLGGYATLEQLQDGEEVVYDALEDAGRYYFRREGNKVYIRSNMNNNTAVADYDELLTAFHNFAEEVRAWFLKEFPILKDDYYWGAWLRGEE